jgi:hypothetical protein
MSGPFKKRGRGNRRPAAEIEAEKVDIVDMMNKDVTKSQMAEELGISRTTIHRRLKELKVQYAANNTEGFAALRDSHRQVLLLIEEKLLEGLDTKVAAEWRAIRKDLSTFDGLDAPSKHITARVDAESSPLFLRLKKATSGLTDEQVEDACKYLAGIPREAKARVVDASWFPAPAKKELPDETA